MIAAAKEDAIRAISPTTAAGLRLRGLLTAYGLGWPFLPFWSDGAGGAAALLSGRAVAVVPPARREEWALFLAMQPAVREVETDPGLAARLAGQGFGAPVERPLLRLPALSPPPDTPPAASPSLWEVYPLLREVFGEEALPPFDLWLTDMSHRLRHRCGRAVGITAEGTLQSAALVTAECETAGLIGGVATRPAARGQGYARACVAALCAGLAAEGKAAYICPKNAAADALYRRWGAAEVGRTCCLSRDPAVSP